MDYENFVAFRLTQLRLQAGLSARDLSLSIGQSPGYINKIESRQNLPSLPGLFAICEYFQISPAESFDQNNSSPQKMAELTDELKGLSERQPKALAQLVDSIKKP